MAERKSQAEILPSLLDRLTDHEPAVRQEAPLSPAQQMRQLRAALRRDMEWLLNARRTIVPLPSWCKELPYSGFQYGLPDLTSYALTTSHDQNRLVGLIESAVALFEPRLKNVTVTLLPVAGGARVLKFQIDGLLRVEPGPERIQFDTTLELTSGTYTVEGNTGAG